MRAGHITGRQIQLFILGASLVAFAGAFISVGLPRHISPLEPVRTARVRVMRWPARQTNDSRYALAELLEPSLLALPNARGFSGEAWQRAPGVRYEPGEFPVAPATLALGAPAPPAGLLPPTPLPAQVQAAVERAAPTLEFTNLVALAGPPLAQSVFRISDALAARAIVRAPPLGLIESAVPLRPAVVRIGVGADGGVRYAVLERTCGDTTVDARAVALAREFRFEPRAQAMLTASLEWGLVRFLWAFGAPVVTNAATTAAP